MINNKTFEHRPINELMAIVKEDFRKLDNEGLIDEGRVIKTIMWCNEKLGIPIRELKETCLIVEDGKVDLPLDFDKLYFVCGLRNKKSIVLDQPNPFDNTFDSDVIYEANLERGRFGGTKHYQVVIKKSNQTIVHEEENWIELEVAKPSQTYCHSNCPNIRNRHGATIYIENDKIILPFEKGELFIMYLGNMKDREGNLLFPFHPLTTPWYEWCIKEKILMDAIFNSEGNYGEMLKLAKQEKNLAWLDAFNITTEKSYGEYIDLQRKKEQEYYNKYFKYLT